MLETGFSTQEIVQFLASMFPVTGKQINDMLPKRGMSLTISQTPMGQRVKVIKQDSCFAVYVNYAQVQP
jgi:hypothetical protein